MGGRPASVAALVVLSCVAATAQEPVRSQPRCREYGAAPVLRICTALEVKTLQLGSSGVWTVRVEGDGGKRQIRIHNSSPAVVSLEGGDDRIVEVQPPADLAFKLATVGPGDARLSAKPYSNSSREEATRIAEAITPLLKQILSGFEERRAALRAADSYSPQAVAGLLNDTETQLFRTLNYPELEPLRDHVEAFFDEARATLSKSGDSRGAAARSIPAVRLARLEGEGPRKGLPAAVDAVLLVLARHIERLYELATRDDLVVDVCVASAPETGLSFEMHPQSNPRLTGTATNHEISNVYRGIYVYRLTRGAQDLAACASYRRCPAIDLVDRPPLVYCDLKASACFQRSDLTAADLCKAHGH